MAQATDWQNIANQARDKMSELASLDSNMVALRDFYDKNQADSYWTALSGGDQIGDSGLTKDQFVSVMTLIGTLGDLLDNAAPTQGDYRATIEQTRSTD